ncbi:family 20 glycosylhydrolase [Pontibacter silvestris]|uniref:beta-N-acetylhexosaminidase n=1 Tax=Pontibacter silvestris TaxID=2305183 RepID=A0ABW4X0E0_9BACT|nr:family 20 glycosylhydrolase [Pontibacter silvestris]MCC9138889.1 carbohydate-binding domain-containing protein [Pontibacter silvestris]
MKYLLSVAFCSISTFTSCFAQVDNQKPEAQELQVTWELLDNYYQNKNQTLSAVTLTNTGKAALPAKGWSLYFNASPSFKPKETAGAVKVEHVNGDLLRLVPTEKFESIASGASQSIEFTSAGRLVNFSQAPDGFYLVWDDNPEVGVPVKNTVKKPAGSVSNDSFVSPETIYNKNRNIQDIPAEKLTKVFPTPAQYSETNQTFTLTAAVPIVAENAFRSEADILATHLATILGKQPAVQSSGKGKVICLQKKKGLQPEAYELQVSSNGIIIAASTPAGIFYGTQSLITLLPPAALATTQKAVSLPGVDITDAPRFGHRAFMLDVARNFQPKQQVLKILDLMALYKLNVFHFHLNDDEGWRLEIPALPELTQVGGKRGHTLNDKKNLVPSYASGPNVSNTAGSGFYSKADFIEILQYAKARHIRVIPEIETPGHARAAIKAMDARYERLMQEGKKQEAEQYLLRDLNDQSAYRSVQHWKDNVIDVSLPSTYDFLETVVDEMLQMYKMAGAPIETIHFGGDEVPSGVWEKSPSVQALIKNDPSVNNTGDLWFYYFGKVNKMVKARNLYLSGWEEIGLRKEKQNGRTVYVPNPDFADENFHVDVWNNLWGAEDLAYKMANAGYKVVLTNVTNFYLDLAYQKDYDEPGLFWGGFLDVDKPFYFIPFDYTKNFKEDTNGDPVDRSKFKNLQKLTVFGKSNIVGLQGPLWSEKITSPERMEYMLLPKLLGLAERAWAKDPAWATEPDEAKSVKLYNQAWSDFVNTLGKRELPRLTYYAGGFNYRIPTPGAKVEDGKVQANVQLPGLTVRYTTDGTEPTTKSKEYTGPISAKGSIKLKVFDVKGRSGRAVTIDNK